MEKQPLTDTFFFNKEEKHKEISYELLAKSRAVLDPFRKPPSSRPVEAYQFVEQINDILSQNNIVNMMRPITVQQNGSQLYLNRNELESIPQNEIPIENWSFVKILMQWIFPHETNLKPGITVAFHERGIDLAFGIFNEMCYNHCVFGDKWYTTYNTKLSQRRLYEDMINGLIAWLHNFEQHLSLDRERIELMIGATFPKAKTELIIDQLTGKLFRQAYNQAYGTKEPAPLTITGVGKFTGGLIKNMDTIKGSQLSVWDIYNTGTALMKPEHMNIEDVNFTNVMWGEFILDYFIPSWNKQIVNPVQSN